MRVLTILALFVAATAATHGSHTTAEARQPVAAIAMGSARAAAINHLKPHQQENQRSKVGAPPAKTVATDGFTPFGREPRGIYKGVGGGGGPIVDQKQNPVIALVVDKCTPKAGMNITANSCNDDFYVRWLESAGIRVVPMFAYWPWEQKKALLQQVNGALLPGGTITGQPFTDYINNVTDIIQYALEEPNFLLWGTCQGMQVISIVINNHDESVLQCDYQGMYPLMMPLDFTTYRPYSTIFGEEAERRGVVDDLANYNTTVNYHHCGVASADWKPTLTSGSKIVSTNVDAVGKEFISTFEIVGGAYQNNIFATQYHPERAPYEFDEDAVYRLSDQTFHVSNYLALFVRRRLMLNQHVFAGGAAEVNQMVLETYTHVSDGYGGGTYWMQL